MLREFLKGVTLALGLALGIIVAFIVMMWATGGFEQVNRAQKFRTEFAQRCAANHGKVVTMRKSSVSRVCVGPDGRWLEYY